MANEHYTRPDDESTGVEPRLSESPQGSRSKRSNDQPYEDSPLRGQVHRQRLPSNALQFAIRTQDGDEVVIATRLANTGFGEGYDSAEVIGAAIVHANVSNIQVDDLLSLIGQATDFLGSEAGIGFNNEVRRKWRGL